MILHVLLFLLTALVIVVMSAFYAEADDSAALASVPRRYLRFVGACAVLVLALLGLGQFSG